jgi:hypothetical protein
MAEEQDFSLLYPYSRTEGDALSFTCANLKLWQKCREVGAK